MCFIESIVRERLSFLVCSVVLGHDGSFFFVYTARQKMEYYFLLLFYFYIQGVNKLDITSFGFPVAAASRQLCSLPPTPPPTQRQRYHRRKRPLCQTYQRGGVLVNHPLRTLTYRTPSLTSVSVHHQTPLSVATQQRRQQWSHTILPPTHPPHQQQHWHVNPFEYLD
jgi:hypothetical protein